MDKYIKTSVAAEMLCVSTVTIQNLCRKNVLRYVTRNRSYLVSLADVEKYAGQINAVNKLEMDIDAYTRSVEARHEQIKKERDYLGDALRTIRMTPKRVVRIREIIDGMLESAVRHGVIDERARGITSGVMRSDLAEVGEAYGLSVERIRQITTSSARKILNVIRRADELSAANEMLRAENAQLRAAVKRGRSASEEAEQRRNAFLYGKETLSVFSVRTQNCLKAISIDSVYSLCQLKEEDLYAVRNMGRKSVYEIKDFLARNSLSLGLEGEQVEIRAAKFFRPVQN